MKMTLPHQTLLKYVTKTVSKLKISYLLLYRFDFCLNITYCMYYLQDSGTPIISHRSSPLYYEFNIKCNSHNKINTQIDQPATFEASAHVQATHV
jgi:hypothetical protein